MHVVGIVAEYNPFHAGHRWQIDALRSRLGADTAVVAVMSGNWVQRGDAAITDKWARSRMALEGGADLVLELPTVWAASSAESFARGAVALLHASGVVDTLCFGSESGDLEALASVARCLDSAGFQTELRRFTSNGTSFAAARQAAVQEVLGDSARLLSAPNNNLGVEYLRALAALSSSIRPMTLPRQGAGHDSQVNSPYPSASWLRRQILGGALPLDNPASLRFNERGVLTLLRSRTPEELAALPDCGEGLHNRLYRAIRAAESLEQLYEQVKTKRYAHARIRRLVLWAYLGLRAVDRPPEPLYLRVLGFGPRGQALLRRMEDTAALPVLTKPARIRSLSPEAQALFAHEARCTDLYGLCRRDRLAPCGLEWTTSPLFPGIPAPF